MATFLIVHGAWTGGWIWTRLRKLLNGTGHDVYTPTLTGLGERAHLAHAGVNLTTHVQDVLAVLEHEDLHDVVLLAHSYGGMVATAVLHHAPHRMRQAIYLDAFVPQDGQCLFDLLPAGAAERHRMAAAASPEGWHIPPQPLPDDTLAADAAWIVARRRPQPLHTFDEAVRLPINGPLPPRRYVYCTRSAPGDVFRTPARRAQVEPGWQSYVMDSSHSPHVTAPGMLVDELQRLL